MEFEVSFLPVVPFFYEKTSVWILTCLGLAYFIHPDFEGPGIPSFQDHEGLIFPG